MSLLTQESLLLHQLYLHDALPSLYPFVNDGGLQDNNARNHPLFDKSACQHLRQKSHLFDSPNRPYYAEGARGCTLTYGFHDHRYFAHAC